MIPETFPEANKLFTSEASAALPAHVAAGLVTTRWRLTWRERLRLLRTGTLWAQTTSPVLGLDLKAPQLTSPAPAHRQ